MASKVSFDKTPELYPTGRPKDRRNTPIDLLADDIPDYTIEYDDQTNEIKLKSQSGGESKAGLFDEFEEIDGPLYPENVVGGKTVINHYLKRASIYANGDWRTLSSWTSPSFLQTDVGKNAKLAFSVYELGEYGSDKPIFRVRRSSDDKEADFYGSEYGSVRFFNWAGTDAVFLTKLYDQKGSTVELIQPTHNRQTMIANNGAVIDWIANPSGSGDDMVASNTGLTTADNLSVFVSYSSRIAAAPDTTSASVWALGDGNNSSVLAQFSSSGYTSGETVSFDTRESNFGTERVGSNSYIRSADTTVIEATFMTQTGMSFYQDDVAVDLNTNNNTNPASDDYSPSSRTITDILTIGAARVSSNPLIQTELTVNAIVFYDTDQSSNRTEIYNELKKTLSNNFRVMSFNVWDFDGTNGSDPQYVAMEKFVERYQPDVLILQEIDAGSVAFLTSTFADNNGYTSTYFGQTEVRGIVIFSKYPIVFNEIVDSPDGTPFDRPARYVEIDYRGNKVGVYGIHSATFCLTPPCSNANPVQEQKRATELEIIGLHKTARLSNNSNLRFIIAGDFNGDSDYINHADTIEEYVGAPSTVTFPITVSPYPQTQLSAYGFDLVDMTNLIGDSTTVWVGTPNTAITENSGIDNIAFSSGITLLGSEIGDSEVTQDGGIVKYGSTLLSGDSRIASDHKPIIVDFKLDG